MIPYDTISEEVSVTQIRRQKTRMKMIDSTEIAFFAVYRVLMSVILLTTNMLMIIGKIRYVIISTREV